MDSDSPLLMPWAASPRFPRNVFSPTHNIFPLLLTRLLSLFFLCEGVLVSLSPCVSPSLPSFNLFLFTFLSLFFNFLYFPFFPFSFAFVSFRFPVIKLAGIFLFKFSLDFFPFASHLIHFLFPCLFEFSLPHPHSPLIALPFPIQFLL